MCAIKKNVYFYKNCLNFYIHFCLNCVHLYNNKMCALLQEVCILFSLDILTKISPLQYRNTFYAPAYQGNRCMKDSIILLFSLVIKFRRKKQNKSTRLSKLTFSLALTKIRLPLCFHHGNVHLLYTASGD